VFGFSHFVTGSFDYAAPYAHEATHGLLVCLLLVMAILLWLDGPTTFRGAVVGLLVGLSLVLKPEIALAAGLVTAVALAIQFQNGPPFSIKGILAGAAAAVLPTAAFTAYFSVYVPWGTALAMACRAWLSAISSTRYVGDVVQTGFLGLDQPWPHFIEHVKATFAATLIIIGIEGGAWYAGHLVRPLMRWLVVSVTAGVVVSLACFKIDWINSGRCLFGVGVIYAIVCAVQALRHATEEGRKLGTARLLVTVLAIGLMARMVLNGRIYQFGFYQAALAGVLVPAIILGDLPARLSHRLSRATAVGCGLLFLVPGIFMLAGYSERLLRLKTHAVGEGLDRFYTFPPEIEPTGEIVRLVSEQLRQTPSDQTVLVLPEGEMINYLSRRSCPVAPFFFFSAATNGGREESIVEDLKRHPPDWVVIISRDLREYGVQRYGATSGQGKLIMRWVDENYRLSGHVGGDPLAAGEHGAVILGRP
jgi:hypothetical protein